MEIGYVGKANLLQAERAWRNHIQMENGLEAIQRWFTKKVVLMLAISLVFMPVLYI